MYVEVATTSKRLTSFFPQEEAKNEEEEFDRELKKMVRESAEARKLENRNVSIGNMTVPTELYSSKDKKPSAVKAPKDAMAFRVLVRKGNKQQVLPSSPYQLCSETSLLFSS